MTFASHIAADRYITIVVYRAPAAARWRVPYPEYRDGIPAQEAAATDSESGRGVWQCGGSPRRPRRLSQGVIGRRRTLSRVRPRAALA